MVSVHDSTIRDVRFAFVEFVSTASWKLIDDSVEFGFGMMVVAVMQIGRERERKKERKL